MHRFCHNRDFYNGVGTSDLIQGYSYKSLFLICFVILSTKPGSTGCGSWAWLTGKFERWPVVVPNMFDCYYDSYLLYIVGLGRYNLWAASLLSALQRENVLSLRNSTRDARLEFPSHEKAFPKVLRLLVSSTLCWFGAFTLPSIMKDRSSGQKEQRTLHFAEKIVIKLFTTIAISSRPL